MLLALDDVAERAFPGQAFVCDRRGHAVPIVGGQALQVPLDHAGAGHIRYRSTTPAPARVTSVAPTENTVRDGSSGGNRFDDALRPAIPARMVRWVHRACRSHRPRRRAVTGIPAARLMSVATAVTGTSAGIACVPPRSVTSVWSACRRVSRRFDSRERS